MKSMVSRALVALALAAAGCGVFSALAPSDAEAAGGCWNRGPDRSRTFGNGIPVTEHYKTWYCYAYRAGDVWDGSVTGYLYAGTSWFVCQKKWPGHENPPVGSARNDWWLWTLGDRAANPYTDGWGWFPATKISGGANWGRIPGHLPDCDTVPGSWVTAGAPYGP
jgi:hypothetical protein